MGYGKRSDFTKITDSEMLPGPGGNNSHIIGTIAKTSIDNSNKHLDTTFQNGYDKYSQICYKGMEK